MKKIVLSGLAMGMMLLSAVNVSAATFTTEDGVLSIETPDADSTSETQVGSWYKIADPTYWFTISDGKSTITIDHLSNGETLPQVQVADDTYAAVYQAFVSTKNEIFVVKALAADTADLQNLMEITGSIKVLKYDTKTAINTSQTANVSEFGVREINATYYSTTDGLNVRTGCSIDSPTIGSLDYNEVVTVKGAVTRNGQDYGWYQVSYGGTDAYVSAGFLSATKSGENAAESTSGSGTATGDTITVYWLNGNGETLYLHTDGSYYNADGVRYVTCDGDYVGADGTTLYTTPNALDDYMTTGDGEDDHHMLRRQEDGQEVSVGYGLGAFYDDDGTEYNWLDDGTMMDFYGHIYDVLW